MILDEPLTRLLPLIALYPEIHYRFKLFPFCRYFRRQPEIIADAPYRLDPGQSLPVLLIVKDADRSPVTLEKVDVHADCGHLQFDQPITLPTQEIRDHFWQHIEWIELPDAAPCIWKVSVRWQVRINGRSHQFWTDNLPGLSHRALEVTQSGRPLPAKPGWVFGDMHVHTVYTEDQVEFGAPLIAYPALGPAMGCSFAFAADHSYDLDDQPGSYYKIDPELRRYRARADHLDRLAKTESGRFVLLPGYELSVSNSRDRNVHLLLINQQTFLPGTGDSAERWLITTCELNAAEALQRLDVGTLAVAAHPRMRPPLLEKLLLRRGRWEMNDLHDPELWGLQVCNGAFDAGFRAGLQVWVEGLLQGRRWKIVAGSDAHGNFNRFRQVGFPMLRLVESNEQLFGCVWTGVKLEKHLNSENLLEALKLQPSLISNGPFAGVELQRGTDDKQSAVAQAISSPEFGDIESVRLLHGQFGELRESTVLEVSSVGSTQYTGRAALSVKDGYLRMEVMTNKGKACYTNPVYFKDP
ncbi:MAG: hypothetical protein NTW14_11045 [bacterium]|nr:hypothetical protein [bacterium]